jgi:hypothetical protein
VVSSCFLQKFEAGRWEVRTTTHQIAKISFSLSEISVETRLQYAPFVVNTELHIGARPSARLSLRLHKKNALLNTCRSPFRGAQKRY